ncbi:uncharacterized protein [Argopecten irradians]|uniref:uncharacterized protein n=1 Tax=Argopecten irradians TaxID=31199 RepID=UPI003711A932
MAKPSSDESSDVHTLYREPSSDESSDVHILYKEPSSDESSDENGPAAKKVKIDPGFLPNDVILIVEDQRLYVNRDLLVSASPVFEAMLKKEWQGDQQTESGKVELSLPGKSVEDMTKFLRCLLPFFSDKVSEDTTEAVLPLADESKQKHYYLKVEMSSKTT